MGNIQVRMFGLYCLTKFQYNHAVTVSLRVLALIAGLSDVGILLVAKST